MSHYQRFTNKKPSGELEDYIHTTCSDCGGAGWYYADGIPLHTIPCSTCNGTGHGKVNQSKLGKVILVALILLGLGFGICKLLNL